MGLFSMFKKKSELEVLENQQKLALEESFRLSKVNRTKADEKLAEADEISLNIEALKAKSN